MSSDKCFGRLPIIFGVHLLLFSTVDSQTGKIFSTSSISSTLNELSFSPDNFIVRFNPYVALNDTSKEYDESDLVRMMGLIASKFSSVLTPRIGVADVVGAVSLSMVATSVAKFNSEQNGHIKVYMAFGDSNPVDVSKGNLASFDVVLQVAMNANAIHNGTVEYFLVKPKGLGAHNKDKVLGEVVRANDTLQGRPYKVGGLFPISTCIEENSTVSEFLEPLLPHIELAVFTLSPIEIDYINGVKDTVVHFIQQFETCIEILRRVAPSVEVGFRTSWSDSDNEGNNRNTADLVYFWAKMNDWAVKNQTKIFMLEAFDIPSRKKNDRYKGWWKLISKGRWGDDIYEDKLGKMTKFPKKQRKFHPNEHNGGISLLGTVLIAVFTCLALMGVMGMMLFVLYRRVSKKIKIVHCHMTNEELKEFFEGSGPKPHGAGTGDRFKLDAKRDSVDALITSVNAIAYNKEYELQKKEFVIQEESVLGLGNFGIVCKGKVITASEEVEVAVKMLKTGGPKTGLKGLLSETKLQSRLGKHDNVVSLIGAYTAELRKGVVYVFTEICEMGSLEKYLRRCYAPRYSLSPGKSVSFNEDADGEDEQETSFEENVEHTQAISGGGGGLGPPQRAGTDKMYRWACEIACGMEFLASKKVVHADLATRNILLTNALTTKISDFGLSRRLYDYTSYIKSEAEPLPWAWMAPEALKRMEFNEKTDVWAYGITLWEIYSLGEKPYPGRTWSYGFAGELLAGLRPGEPPYNSNNMYTTMLKCWHNDPAKRPSFKVLYKRFNKIPDNSLSELKAVSPLDDSKETQVRSMEDHRPNLNVYLVCENKR